MTPPPACTRVGSHCLSLRVTLRIAELNTGEPSSADDEATWLLGHTERIDFGPIDRQARELRTNARLHVRCRFAREEGGRVSCQAHGFSGRVAPPKPARRQRRLGPDRFEIVERGRLVTRGIKPPPAPRRALAVLGSENPCAIAVCRTADNRVGAACCRDLQIEILCSPREKRLESLIRTRQSPYLCKVSRESPDSLGAEMISACSYLEPGTPLCTLHGRKRRSGAPAKPDLCFVWPDDAETFHPRCAFGPDA